MNANYEPAGQPVVLIVFMEDAPVHTDDHTVCNDPTCPCRDEYEDCIPDDLPTEEEIEAMFEDHARWLSEHL